MTRKERRNPGLLDGSRRRRIAAGAGVQVQDVNKLMKQFMEMQKMMKSMSGGRMKRMMQAFKGGMPPGFPGPVRGRASFWGLWPSFQRSAGPLRERLPATVRIPGPTPITAFAKSLVCVESALFFGRPGRVFRPRGLVN